MFGNFHRLFFTRYVSLLALKFNLLLYGKLKVDVQICLHESSGELGFEKNPPKIYVWKLSFSKHSTKKCKIKKALWLVFRSTRDNGCTATPHLMRHCHNFFKALQLGASSSFFNSNRMAETNFSLADWTPRSLLSLKNALNSFSCTLCKALMSSKSKVVRAKLIQLSVFILT